tara:strand:- start:1 stop:144 length:144 start_codon:yes stop_codon:yes gene_type:complete
MKQYICTKNGELIYVYLDLKKGIIQSLVKGGISALRKNGWNIAKKRR